MKLYNTCILPIFLYGSEFWAVTKRDVLKIDALDQWRLYVSCWESNANLLQNDNASERSQSIFYEVMMFWNVMAFFFMDHPVDMVECYYVKM